MKFSSPHLQKIFDESRLVLDNIDSIKNSISEDIKNLENYLKSTSINENFEYAISRPDQNTWFPDFDGCSGNGTGIEECLVWDHRKKRLIYIKNKYDTSVDTCSEVHPVYVDEKSCVNLVEKPLIEMQFDIRKRVHDDGHLGHFLKCIAAKYSAKNLLKHEEIPF